MLNDKQNDGVEAALGTTAEPEPEGPGLLLDALARLPEKAILDEARLASLLRVTPRTVRRMVSRFELPPPTRLGARSVWLCGRVLAHIEASAERAAHEADRQARRFRELSA